MEPPTDLSLHDRWAGRLAKVPLPIRMMMAAWLLLSLLFNFGLPSSTKNLQPWVEFVVLLPMALVSLGLSSFILWNGCKTLLRTSKSVFQSSPDRKPIQRPTLNFIGGVGALNIYMSLYLVTMFGIARPRGYYAADILSCLLCAGITFILFKRGPHATDIKIFLWGSLGVTALFGLINATVAAPST